MHLKRWLTALISIPLLIIIIGPAPDWIFVLLLVSVSIASLSEFYRITSPDLPIVVRWFCYVLTCVLFILIFFRQFMAVPVIIILFAFIVMAYYMFSHSTPSRIWTADIGKALLGAIYIVLPISLLLLINLNPNGKPWIFFLLAIIFANDTGALYSGKLFGKHKLYQEISPNKTWEGAAGGFVLSLLIGLIFLRLWPFQQLDIGIICLILLLSVSAQIGDLSESMIKRNHGIDDSGFLLPGHGGFLDRIDGLLFAIPILYVYTLWRL
jgi:phosphatidate cytidylyltransferase